jgi:hypothetical protein
MFIAALYTIAKLWKQPRCPITDEWIKKRWYLYMKSFLCHLEFFSFGTGGRSQVLILAKQASLYYLSHAHISFWFEHYWERVLLYAWAGCDLPIYISPGTWEKWYVPPSQVTGGKWGLETFFPRLIINCYSPNLCFPSS